MAGGAAYLLCGTAYLHVREFSPREAVDWHRKNTRDPGFVVTHPRAYTVAMWVGWSLRLLLWPLDFVANMLPLVALALALLLCPLDVSLPVLGSVLVMLMGLLLRR